MNISFGEYKGKSVIELILDYPHYTKWILNQVNATEPLLTIQNETKRLTDIFDSKSFIKKCYGQNCFSIATRCSAHKDDFIHLQWWCDNCNPYQSGSDHGKLHIIKTYADVLNYVEMISKNRESNSIALIKQLMHEKGLPKRAGKKDINSFFLEKGILTF